MSERVTVNVFVLIDSAGDYAIGTDSQEARDRYQESLQCLADTEGFRIVELNLSVALPAILKVSGTVPDEAGEVALTVA